MKDETKKEVSDLTDEIIDAYRDMLKEESFLSEETRRSAVTKLDNLPNSFADTGKVVILPDGKLADWSE